MGRWRWLSAGLWLAVGAAGAAAPAPIAVSGEIRGASGKSDVYVALWDEGGFMKKPVQRARFAPGAAPVFHFEAPPGRYALSAFEDKNGNGELDMGMFGPKEPSGFYRPFTARHKPSFEEVAFTLSAPLSGADVQLK